MEDSNHGFYGGGRGGGQPNSQSHMFHLHSPAIYTPALQLAPTYYQNYQNPVRYSGTFFPSITPSIPMDQNNMLFNETQCTNRQQLMSKSYLDNTYTDFNRQVIDLSPSKRIPIGSSTKSKKNDARGQWTKKEDRQLIELHNRLGNDWAGISAIMQGRAGKQCRERYINYLAPNIKRDEWSEDEVRILIEAHKIHGESWVKIAKFLPGRTENQIKNLWHSTKRKSTCRKHKSKKSEPENGYPKPTILSEYIHNHATAGSTSTSNTTNPTTSTTIFASDEPPPVDSNLNDSSSFDVIPYCDDELEIIMENLLRDTPTVSQPETTAFNDQTSPTEHLQPQSHPNLSPLGFNENSEYVSSSSLFPTNDSVNVYQNNEYPQSDIQVSPDDYFSNFLEPPTFSHSFDLLYDYGYKNTDAEFNADQGGDIFGQ